MTRPLRVLIIEPGRVAHWHHTTSVARALAQRGADVRLAALFPAIFSYEEVAGVEEVPVSVIGRRRDGKSNGSRSAYRQLVEHTRNVWGLIRVIQEFKPEVVHLQPGLGRLDFLYVKLIKFLGARVAYTAYTPYDASWPHWIDVLHRLLYRAVDLIVVHSSNSFPRLTDYYRIEKSKILELPLPSQFPFAQDRMLPREVAKASLGLPAGAHVMLFFGFIAPRKRLDVLIDAHAKLCNEHPDVYLIIAGEPPNDFTTYQDRIVEHGLSGRIILDLRYVPFDRMCVYFSAADVVVLPYQGSYSSGVLQWAYAFGRPVVVTDVGDLREAVTADGTGLIAGEGDREGLARAILALLMDQNLARTMGDRALQVSRTKYSWDVVSGRLEAAYRVVLACDARLSHSRIGPG